MKIECAFIKHRDMQVNASLSPPPVWKMDLCLCNHDEKLLYVYDKYSLIWFTHKNSNFQSHGNKTCPVLQINHFPYVLDCAPCLTFDTVTAHHIVYACTYKWIQNIYALSTLSWFILRLGCLESSQTMELLHGIRYVKKLFCLMNPTRRGSYGLIERGTFISLKISPICSVPELAHDIFSKSSSNGLRIVTSWI